MQGIIEFSSIGIMGILDQKKEIYDYWNGKGIIVHKRMTPDIEKRLSKALREYSIEEIKAAIDFYATILEPNVSPANREYWWSYKWNLAEFCMRGIAKFDGQELSNYRRHARIDAPEAVVIKRKV